MSGRKDEQLLQTGMCLGIIMWQSGQKLFLILRIYYYVLDLIIIHFPQALLLKAPVLTSPTEMYNLLITGLNMYCIFDSIKFLQMESCHLGK